MDRIEKGATADLLHYIAGIPLPSGDIVGLDRAVRAARVLAARARRGKDTACDYLAPDPDVVEARMRAVSAAVAPAACSTWTVDTDPLESGPWTIRRDGHLVDTVAARYGADDVLAIAEQHARCHMAWVLDPDIAGLRSVTSAEVAEL